MKLKLYTQFNLSEAFKSKSVDVDNELTVQAKLNDQINVAKKNLSKIDSLNKNESEKTLEKSKIVSSIAKLTLQIAQSMNKQAIAMQALSKEQSKQ